MYLNSEVENCILGSGGGSPGIFQYDLGTGQSNVVLRATGSHSIYAIDIEPATGMIAGGSNQGTVYFKPLNQLCDSGSANKLIPAIDHGAPILALHWLAQDLLAVADTAGECKIWSPKGSFLVVSLPTQGEMICGLVKVDNHLLVGLTITGRLLFWNYQDLQLVRTIVLRQPPPQYGLVNLTYNPTNSQLVYPTVDGELVILKISSGEQARFPAHQGDFYALCNFEEKFLSIGRHDGRLKLWSFEKCVGEIQFSHNVVAVTAIEKSKIITLDEDGDASIHSVSEQGVKQIASVPGRHYRSVLKVAKLGQRKSSAEFIKAEIEVLLNAIQNCHDQERADEAEEHHNRLVELGYEHLSLGIKAENEIATGNIIKAAQFYRKVLDLIPRDNQAAFRVMHQYANLLEKMWLLDEAYQLYSDISNFQEKNSISTLHIPNDRLTGGEPENWIINPENTNPEVFQAAAAIGIPLSGRYLLKVLDELSFPDLHIEPQEIFDKYLSMKDCHAEGSCLKMEFETAVFIDKEGVQPIDVVLLAVNSEECAEGLMLVAKTDATSSGSIVTPMLILDCYSESSDINKEQRNLQISDIFNKNISRTTVINIAEAVGNLRQIISRLANEKLSRTRSL